MTKDSFVEQLLARVPEADGVVSEHMSDQEGELLIHLLMADLLRFAVERFHGGHGDVVGRVLEVVDRGLREGDEHLENAVAVSFVEHVGFGEGQTPAFLATWPAGLLAEKAAQDAWYRDNSTS